MEVVNIFSDNSRVIRIINPKNPDEYHICHWLYYNGIQYSLNDRIYKHDADYWGKVSCCFCSEPAIHALFNGYHNHKCKNKHYRTNSTYTSLFCQKCFNFAINQVKSNRLLVYQIIKSKNMISLT